MRTNIDRNKMSKITSHFSTKEDLAKSMSSPSTTRQRSFSLPRQGVKRDLNERSPDAAVSQNKMTKNDSDDGNDLNKEHTVDACDIRPFMKDITSKLTDITATNNTVLSKLNNIESSLEGLKIKVSNLEEKCTNNAKKIETMCAESSEDFNSVRGEIDTLKTDIQQIMQSQPKTELLNDVATTNHLHSVIIKQYKCLKQEIDGQKEYSQRSNLIFENIPEKKNENPVLVIDSLLGQKLGLPNAKFEIDKAHRLGQFDKHRNRPIIVKFKTHHAKEVCYNRRKMLKGTGIFVNLHLTDEHRRESTLLDRATRFAQRTDPSARRQNNRVIYKQKAYTITELRATDLPVHKLHQRESETAIGFLGKLSPFSNFYDCELSIDGCKYENVEKYFQCKKAEMYGDMQTMSEILLQEDPATIKRLAKKITGPDGKPIQRDLEAETQIMEKALDEKFKQHELKRILLSTENKLIVECSVDRYWGCGLGLQDDDALNRRKWTGSNKLGYLLSQIRDKLKN